MGNNVVTLDAAIGIRQQVGAFLGLIVPGGLEIPSENLQFLDQDGIQELLLERPPFFMINKAVAFGSNEVLSIAHISVERCAGHFPGHPIIPLIRMCECAAQTALILGGLNAGKDQAPIAVGSGDSKAHARNLVEPPVTLVISAKKLPDVPSGERRNSGRRLYVDTSIWVGDELVGSLVRIECVLMKKGIILNKRKKS